MTEEQVTKWREQRDKAKQIEDPEAREKALDIVYDMKDDLQLECQRKMADRIKGFVESDKVQQGKIAEIKSSVQKLQSDFEEDHETVKEIKEGKLKASGVVLALKWLGYIAAAGGGSVITWLLSVASKAAEAQ